MIAHQELTEKVLRTKLHVLDTCRSCPLCEISPRVAGELKKKVDGQPSILVVGEAPGVDEWEKPFQGKHGALTKALLEKLGLLPYCSFTNVVKCRPWIIEHKKWGDKKVGKPPGPIESSLCRSQFLAEIEYCKPDVILLLGAAPMAQLLPASQTGNSITAARGNFYDFNGIPTMPTFSPSAVLNSGSQTILDQIILDLKNLRSKITGREIVLRENSVKWSYIKNRQELADLVQKARGARISLDTENNSLDPFYENLKLLLYCVAFSPTESYVVVVEHKERSEVTELTPEDGLRGLIKIMEVAGEASFHNLQYDAPVIKTIVKRRLGIDWSNFKNLHDTIIMHYVVDPGGVHNLDDLSSTLGYGPYKEEPKKFLATLPKDQRNWENIPLRILGRYNAVDGCVGWELFDNLMKKIDSSPFTSRLYHGLLEKAARFQVKCEYAGVLMDLEKNRELESKYLGGMKDLHDKVINNPLVMKHLVTNRVPVVKNHISNNPSEPPRLELSKFSREEFRSYLNLGSPKQLSELFFEQLKLPTTGVRKGKSGYSTDASVLLRFSGEFTRKAESLNRFTLNEDTGEKSYPPELVTKGWKLALSQGEGEESSESVKEVRNLLALWVPHQIVTYRAYSKLYSSYIKPVREKWVDPVTGIYHPDIKLWGTITGRSSAGIHTIPEEPEIKSQFLSKRPGDGLFLSADYSAIEVRIMASFARDEGLIDIFRRGVDIHRQVAAFAFRKELDAVTEMERRYSKTVHFGILYLEGDESLAARLRRPGETLEEVLDYVLEFKGGYFRAFPNVKKHISRMQNCLRYKGVAHALESLQEEAERYVKPGLNKYLVTPFGRLLPIEPDTSSWDMLVRPVNWPIQSSAGDFTLEAAIRCQERFEKEGLYSHVIFTVHDSINVDTCESEVSTVLEIMREEMIENIPSWMTCPVKVDFKVGKNWGYQEPLEAKNMARGSRLGARHSFN